MSRTINVGGVLIVVLTISDFHAPFGSPNAIDFLSDLKKEYRPDKIVCLGDEIDQHSLSDWVHSPEGMSPKDEYEAAIKQLKPLYKLFPNVQVVESNHGRRPFRKAFNAGLPRVYMKAYREFMQAPSGWSWCEYLNIENVLYIHGDGFSSKDGAIRAATGHRKSVCLGHIHAWGGVTYIANNSSQIFAANAGCLIDYGAYAFEYSKHQVAKPTIGTCVVLHEKECRFIPMKL